MSRQHHKVEDRQLTGTGYSSCLSSYPLDTPSFLTLPHYTFDAEGIPFHENPQLYHPATIALYALSRWNLYLATKAEFHRKGFLTQAYWLVEHEVRISDDTGGLPVFLFYFSLFS